MNQPQQQTIWIARHGMRMDFVDPAWVRTAARPKDPPLSAEGFVQAEELGRRLGDVGLEAVYTSPFTRCVQTAHYVAEAAQLPLWIENGLHEYLDAGSFPHKPRVPAPPEHQRQLPRVDPAYVSRWEGLQYPEDWDAVCRRTRRTVQQLADAHTGNILLVSHGAPILALQQALLGPGDYPAPSCCSLAGIVRTPQATTSRCLADTAHLSRTEEEIRFQ